MGQVVIKTAAQKLDDYKDSLIERNQVQALRRIADLLGVGVQKGVDWRRLMAKEMNTHMQATALLDKKIRQQLTQQEEAELQKARDMKAIIDSVRAAENVAADAIRAATTKEEADQVTVDWP